MRKLSPDFFEYPERPSKVMNFKKIRRSKAYLEPKLGSSLFKMMTSSWYIFWKTLSFPYIFYIKLKMQSYQEYELFFMYFIENPHTYRKMTAEFKSGIGILIIGT